MVRFLWDAHNCEEAREEEELVVSTPYIEHWNDLIDLWYLGMQVGSINTRDSSTMVAFLEAKERIQIRIRVILETQKDFAYCPSV